MKFLIAMIAIMIYLPFIQQTTEISQYEWEILYYTNQARIENGCNPVQFNTDLQFNAVVHTQDMVSKDILFHSNLYAIHNYRWSMLAENVAYGYPDAQSVVQGWLESPPHRANILNCRYVDVGISHIGYYDTQLFGRP